MKILEDIRARYEEKQTFCFDPKTPTHVGVGHPQDVPLSVKHKQFDKIIK